MKRDLVQTRFARSDALSSLAIGIGSGVGLNIELAGFCAFLPYLFGAPQNAGGKPANPLKTHGPSVKSTKPQGHFIWFSSPDFVVTWAIFSKCGSGEDFISPAGHVGLPRTTE